MRKREDAGRAEVTPLAPDANREPEVDGDCKCPVSGKRGPTLVLSVPHGCRGEPGCDDAAPLAARKIADAAGFGCILINRVPRSKVDMNRPPSYCVRTVSGDFVSADVTRRQSGVRGEPFRKAVDDMTRDESTLLLDVHSFGEDYGDFGDYDVVVFNMFGSGDDKLVSKLAGLIRDEGGQYGVTVGETRGRPEDDIAVSRGGKSVLVEFREGKRGTVEAAALAVGRAVRKLLGEG